MAVGANVITSTLQREYRHPHLSHCHSNAVGGWLCVDRSRRRSVPHAINTSLYSTATASCPVEWFHVLCHFQVPVRVWMEWWFVSVAPAENQ